MLYLALPPVPTPIVATIASEQTAGKALSVKVLGAGKPTKSSISDSGNASTATAHSSECQLSEAKLQKSNLQKPNPQKLNPQKPSLVNSLLGKMLAASTSVKAQNIACESQKQQSEIVVTQVPNSANAANTNIAVLPEQNSSQQTDSVQIASNSDYNKSAEKNTVGTILTAVQQMIQMSMYASINNAISEAQHGYAIADAPQIEAPTADKSLVIL